MAKKIQINDALPAFSLPNEEGQLIDINDYIGKPLVIYFYPKDDTPGCTKQACSFRDQFADFTDAGVTVFGISADSPASHQQFKAKYRLPFSLLSDKGNVVRKLLGVPTDLLGLLPGRVTYIIDKQGNVAHIFKSQMAAEKHVEEALATIQAMN